jgi:hypothetical protein
MDPAIESYRLLDIMPASGRMLTKIQSKPQQSTVIESPFPKPWEKPRLIFVNFDLWSRLSQNQRDLLMLRTVCWQLGIQWFKVDIYQGLVATGVVGTLFELVQVDAVGIVIAGTLTGLAAAQIWRSQRSSQSELLADEAAIRVAQRRGYSETEAAQYLLEAIQTVAKIEGRPSLSFTELIRCQNLRAIAGLSALGVPEGEIRE